MRNLCVRHVQLVCFYFQQPANRFWDSNSATGQQPEQQYIGCSCDKFDMQGAICNHRLRTIVTLVQTLSHLNVFSPFLCSFRSITAFRQKSYPCLHLMHAIVALTGRICCEKNCMLKQRLIELFHHPLNNGLKFQNFIIYCINFWY